MKIICENMEEYDQLMKASEYLHDFRIEVGGIKEVFQKRKVICLNMDLQMVGFLSHLYLTTDDFPNKFDVIKIEEKDEEEKEN